MLVRLQGYIQWLAQLVSMLKSYICSVNLTDGQPVAKEALPFVASDSYCQMLSISEPGLGDFHAQKVDVHEEMN